MMQKSTLLKTLGLLLVLVSAIAWGTARSGWFEKAPTSMPTAHPAPAVQAVPQAASPSPAPTLASPSTPAESQPIPTASAAPTIPAIPKEHYISQISGHRQYFLLGCEAAVAKDWANYFGMDFNEFDFQYRLPLSDNPDLGFVGDVNSPWGQIPPYGYGVHAAPIATLLNTYGVPAKAYKGYTLEQIKAHIARDKPVIAWVIGNVVGGVPYEYTDKHGNQTIVAAYEHVVIVTGYNETHIRYLTNGRFYETPNAVFLNSWGVLGNMVVVDGR